MSEQMPTINPDEIAGQQFDAESAQAAQQVVNDGNPEYLEHHPNAVTDKVKAEEMAHASKFYEEQVVENANEALRYAEAVDAPGAGHDDLHNDLPHEEYRDMFIHRAQEARNKADQKAQQTADTYDATFGKNQTASEQAIALKSGKSIPAVQDQIRKDKEPKRGFGSAL